MLPRLRPHIDDNGIGGMIIPPDEPWQEWEERVTSSLSATFWATKVLEDNPFVPGSDSSDDDDDNSSYDDDHEPLRRRKRRVHITRSIIAQARQEVNMGQGGGHDRRKKRPRVSPPPPTTTTTTSTSTSTSDGPNATIESWMARSAARGHKPMSEGQRAIGCLSNEIWLLIKGDDKWSSRWTMTLDTFSRLLVFQPVTVGPDSASLPLVIVISEARLV